MKVYSLRRPWTPSDYRTVLSMAVQRCDVFGLVVRESLGKAGESVVSSLADFLLEDSLETAWPGTILLGGRSARVLKYRVEASSVGILQDAAEDLWSWMEPEMPEDLFFLRKDASPWFGSITHERDAFFEVENEEELAELVSRFGADSVQFDGETNATGEVSQHSCDEGRKR